MPTLEEMTAWTLEDIQGELANAMPGDWAFDFDFDPESGWWAKFIASSETGEPRVVQEWYNLPEVRLLLLNAYGWLTARNATPRHPKWNRRTRPDPKPVIGLRTLPGTSAPDPEDLDPSEIQAVYSAHTQTRK